MKNQNSQKELLVPVGSLEHLDYAIFNGCDAVYLGGKRFGARAYASNFTDEEMISAIKKCHLYDVKIYVTVNTMIFERERKSALDYVGFLYKNKVDAVIVSDLGLIRDIHKLYPKMDIHVSTQAHTSTVEQIMFLKRLGATRVVLDRELSLNEIKKIPDLLELEVFIHGALCVSYSGECLISALNETRSGNRGTCAQYCRMKYKLQKDRKYIETPGEYLLSTKELNSTNSIKELVNNNITSFKIEGRMKSKEYVGFITKLYRRLIDSLEEETDEEEKQLKSLFHREFTNGYLKEEKNIMNFKTANHIGIPIGEVIKVTPKKIKIKLTEELTQEDGIKFLPSDSGMIVNFLYNEEGKLIHKGKKGQIVLIDNKVELKECEKIRKTLDKELVSDLQNIKEKKIPISMYCTVSFPKFTLTVSDNKEELRLTKDIAQKAISRETTEQEIKKQLIRLGDTPFLIEKLEIKCAKGLFIPVSKINEIRRDLINLLIEKRCE